MEDGACGAQLAVSAAAAAAPKKLVSLPVPARGSRTSWDEEPSKLATPTWVSSDPHNIFALPSDISCFAAGDDQEPLPPGARSCPVSRLRGGSACRAAVAEHEPLQWRSAAHAEQSDSEAAFGDRFSLAVALPRLPLTKLPAVPPGLAPPPGTPSHGSLMHGSGDCKPCAWFWKRGGCENGSDCLHCHLCPEGEIKARKKNKFTMMRLGLATPKFVQSHEDFAPSFGFEQPLVGAASCEELSTTCSGSELEGAASSTSPPSEDDSAGGSCQDNAASRIATSHPVKVGSALFDDRTFAKDKQAPEDMTREELLARVKELEAKDGAKDRSVLPPRTPMKVQWGPAEVITEVLPSEVPYTDAVQPNAAGDNVQSRLTLCSPPGLDSASVIHTPNSQPLSVGSTLHGTGECRPCAWFWKQGGCQNGAECHHCHLCPEGEIKARRKAKVTVMRQGIATPKASDSQGVTAQPPGFSMGNP